MRLLRLHLFGLGPFDRLKLELVRDDGTLRNACVVFGGDGVGKTTVLSALGFTRPGFALPPPVATRAAGASSFVMSEWDLGDDDLARPHALIVASPQATLDGEAADLAVLRRREQAFFDKRAQEHGGFVFVAFSGARWFSRTPNMLSAPERTVMRYDARTPPSFDDATRADLTRETKQILACASIGAALATEGDDGQGPAFFEALRESLDVLLRPYDVTWLGTNPRTLEPRFRALRATKDLGLEDLPKGARHLIAIGALTLRSMHAAYMQSEEPVRNREAVVAIDDLDGQQDVGIQRALTPLLREAFPRVQWFVSTSSVAVTQGIEPEDVFALRKSEDAGVELHEGPLATLH